MLKRRTRRVEIKSLNELSVTIHLIKNRNYNSCIVSIFIYLHSWLAVPSLETEKQNKNGSGTGGSSLRNQVAEPEILFPLPFRDSLLICLWGGFKGTGVDRMCTSVRVPLKDLFGKSSHHRQNWSKSWQDWSIYKLWNPYLVGNSNQNWLKSYLSHKCKKSLIDESNCEH